MDRVFDEEDYVVGAFNNESCEIIYNFTEAFSLKYFDGNFNFGVFSRIIFFIYRRVTAL